MDDLTCAASIGLLKSLCWLVEHDGLETTHLPTQKVYLSSTIHDINIVEFLCAVRILRIAIPQHQRGMLHPFNLHDSILEKLVEQRNVEASDQGQAEKTELTCQWIPVMFP
ncbi:hypothetical protein ACM66B_005279 [Microbotryomycetes sp. NB124-2]